MTVATVATVEVANRHLEDIHLMLIAHEVKVQGVYQKHWSALREGERATLCKAAGLKEEHINMPLSDMNVRDKRQLLEAIKNMGRIASLFNYADVKRMQGFN